MTKLIEKHKAIEMRKNGATIIEIADSLNVVKSSAWEWVKNVELTDEAKRRIGKIPRKITKEPQLCECGCGDYAKSGKRFILGHSFRNKKHTDATCNKISIGTKNRYNDPKQRKKTSEAGKKRYEDPSERKKSSESTKKYFEDPIAHEKYSAALQHVPYEEWEDFASEKLYCPKFNEECRESNRNKYGRKCFLTGLPEEENITKTGKQRKLSVHHIDMDKKQGCDGKRWKLVPLCLEYHGKAHAKLWESRIIWLLENTWN